MSKITVTIKTDGAAFRVPETGDESGHGADLETEEVSRALSEVAAKIEAGHREGAVLDTNGNVSTTFTVTED